VYILTHRLYVDCERHRDVYCHGNAVYMHIHITLFTEGSSLRRRSPVAHEKNDCQPTIYACRTTVCHLLIYCAFCPVWCRCDYNYGKTSNRIPRLLSLQVNETPACMLGSASIQSFTVDVICATLVLWSCSECCLSRLSYLVIFLLTFSFPPE